MIFLVISPLGIQLFEQKTIAQPVGPQYLVINGNVTLMRGDPHHMLECEYPFYRYTALLGDSKHLIFSAKILNDSKISVDNPANSSPHLSPVYPATGSWTLRDLGDPHIKTPQNVTYHMDGKINSSSILSGSGKHNFSINGFTNYIGDLCFPNERNGFNKPPVNIVISGECHSGNQDIYLKGYEPERGIGQVLAATFNGSINCVNNASAPVNFSLDHH